MSLKQDNLPCIDILQLISDFLDEWIYSVC